jgi:hypothetical protein
VGLQAQLLMRATVRRAARWAGRPNFLLGRLAVGDNTAMEAEPNKAEPSKRKRRRFQFSLRTLLIFTLFVALACAWLTGKVERKRRERASVEALRKKGAMVTYDYNLVRGRNGTPTGPAWLRWLLGENYFSEVVWLNMVGKSSDEDLTPVAELVQLESLDLMGPTFTDAGLRKIAHLTKLRRLMLSQTGVTDAGLANLKELTELDDLWLYGTKVTDAGLVQLRGLTKLTHLSLSFTKVSDRGVDELQRALPNCHIDR